MKETHINYHNISTVLYDDVTNTICITMNNTEKIVIDNVTLDLYTELKNLLPENSFLFINY